jgi:hypothetical protein
MVISVTRSEGCVEQEHDKDAVIDPALTRHRIKGGLLVSETVSGCICRLGEAEDFARWMTSAPPPWMGCLSGRLSPARAVGVHEGHGCVRRLQGRFGEPRPGEVVPGPGPADRLEDSTGNEVA